MRAAPGTTSRASVILLVALWATLAPTAQTDARAAGKPVVAVLPFTSPTRWSSMGGNAQATFVTQLVKTRKLRVIQADMVLRTLTRHGLRWSGVVEPRLLKAAGRWLKADYVLAGKLRWGGDAYMLSVHVMNVGTLETTMAEDVDFNDVRKMRVAVRSAARKIAGTITGTGSRGSNADLFLNVNARAFYDTAEACIRSMRYALGRYRFNGRVEETDDERRAVRIKGYAGRLVPGVPIDIHGGSDSLDGPAKTLTVYFTKTVPGGIEAQARMIPDDGVDLSARATTQQHQYVVAVGRVVDEAEDNAKLVSRFRSVLLEKMSEGDAFQQIEGASTDRLASMSNRRQRFFAYRKLFDRGVEVVLEGKLYGTPGSRRAHLKVYSTLTGKVLGELKFETRL